MGKSIYSIVGMKHRGTETFVRSLPSGEAIDLIRDPTNEHDKNAVQVWARGQHVGFIKATEAVQLAKWIDVNDIRRRFGVSGKLVARQWPEVEIDQ
jgi:hypothetical protein